MAARARWISASALLAVMAVAVVGVLRPGGTSPHPVPPMDAGAGVGRRPAARATGASAPATDAPPPDRELAAGMTTTASAPQAFTGVVREVKDPIAGATVEMFAGLEGDGPRLAVAVTDAEGRFDLVSPAGVAPPFRARASAEGYRGDKGCLLVGGWQTELQLRRMLEVRGSVRSRRDGSPIVGASITDDYGTVQTGERGHYVLQATRSYGRVQMTVSAPGHAAQVEVVAVGDERRFEADFELSPTSPMRVLVVARETGVPIADVDIRDGSGERLGRTDGDGRVTLGVGARQDVTLSLRVPDRCAFEWSWTATDGPLPMLRLQLARCVRVEGNVVDGLGNPVGGAVVEPMSRHVWSDAELQAADLPGRVVEDVDHDEAVTSGDDGRFSVPACPMPASQVVRASRPGFVAVASEPLALTVPGAIVRCDLVMSASATIVGSVRRNGVPWDCSVQWRSGERCGSTFAQHGEYQLDDVPAGPVELALGTGGTERACVANVHLAAGARLQHDFDLDEAVGMIRGRVVTGGAAPLANTTVSARTELPDTCDRSFDVRTDAYGRYELEVLAGHVYRVAVHDGPVSREHRRIAPDTDGVDFDLPAVTRLPLRLIDAATQQPVHLPRGGAAGIAWREQGEVAFRQASTAIDAVGCASLAVPIGRIDLSIALQPFGYGIRRVTDITVGPANDELRIELTRGVDLRLTLRGAHPFADVEKARGVALFVLAEQMASLVGPGRRLEGAARLVDGDRLVDGVVLNVREPGLLQQQVQLDATDGATIRGLTPGRYRLVAFPDDLVFEPATFAIGENAADVELRWRRR